MLFRSIGVVDFWDKGKRVPLFDRFFLGGSRSVRGFRLRDIAPHDEQDESLGGKTYWNATAEYTFPIMDRIRGAIFFDVGDVYPNAFSFSPGVDLRSSGVNAARKSVNAGTGFGFRINSPIGPFRLDLGFPIISDSVNDRGMQIHFDVGYQF